VASHGVVLFLSSAHAVRAEKVLQEAGIRTKLIPTPRQLSSDCGMALRFERADRDRLVAVLAESHVPAGGIHDI